MYRDPTKLIRNMEFSKFLDVVGMYLDFPLVVPELQFTKPTQSEGFNIDINQRKKQTLSSIMTRKLSSPTTQIILNSSLGFSPVNHMTNRYYACLILT